MDLIFLPGASGNTEFWQPVIEKLPQHQNGDKTVIAYPEFGGYPSHIDVNSFTDLQHYVLDQIQQPCMIIAQSMGGIFAVQAALQKPKLVKALVLVATSGGIDLSPFDVADWRTDYQQTFKVPDWFIHQQPHLDDVLYKIACPVLLIWGNTDAISPVAVGKYLHSKIGSSTLHIIKNGQHDLAYVYVDEVAEYINKFISQLHS